MNRFQEALNRLGSINLDIVLEELGYEKACEVSDYGIQEYPSLEMSGDLDTLQELINSLTPGNKELTPAKSTMTKQVNDVVLDAGGSDSDYTNSTIANQEGLERADEDDSNKIF